MVAAARVNAISLSANVQVVWLESIAPFKAVDRLERLANFFRPAFDRTSRAAVRTVDFENLICFVEILFGPDKFNFVFALNLRIQLDFKCSTIY